MLDAANSPHLASPEWKLVDGTSTMARPIEPRDQHPSDIIILAIICHEVLGLPLYFDYSYFAYFRANLTLSLYNGNLLF